MDRPFGTGVVRESSNLRWLRNIEKDFVQWTVEVLSSVSQLSIHQSAPIFSGTLTFGLIKFLFKRRAARPGHKRNAA